MRENVNLVVREYNGILDTLLPQERRLFTERLHFLDRKIYPALTKLTWASKGVVTDVFVKDSRRHCQDASKLVQTFHHSKALLAKHCRQIASTPLVSLRKKQVYPQDLFEGEQKSHQESVRSKLIQLHGSMKQLMKSTVSVCFPTNHIPEPENHILTADVLGVCLEEVVVGIRE